jgi:hypothetical protein
MRSNEMKFSLVAVTISLYCSLATAATPGTIKGRVLDSEGAVIKGAHLLFHLDSSGQNKPVSRSDMARKTDAAGRFDIQLEPGFYDVCVMATAFTPECRKVLVTTGKAILWDTQLKMDALVIQHLGDKF